MRELNTIPASEPAEDYSALEPENFELFTNTNFFDFDTGTQNDFKPDESNASTKPGEAASSTRMMNDLGMVDYMDSAPPSATGRFFFHSVHLALLFVWYAALPFSRCLALHCTYASRNVLAYSGRVCGSQGPVAARMYQGEHGRGWL